MQAPPTNLANTNTQQPLDPAQPPVIDAAHPGQWAWQCGVTDVAVGEYETKRAELDAFMTATLDKAVMCPNCAAVELGNQADATWLLNNMRWIELNPGQQVEDLAGVRECDVQRSIALHKQKRNGETI